jgi:hypothetical protein
MSDEQWTVCKSEVRTAKSKRTELSGVPPDCPVCHQTVRCRKRIKDFNGQPLQTPTVYWRGTHHTVRCAHRQQRLGSGWRLQIPINHLHSSHPSFLNFTFNTRAIAYTPRHNQKIKSSPSLKINSIAKWLERGYLVFLLLLGLLFPSHSNSSSAL